MGITHKKTKECIEYIIILAAIILSGSIIPFVFSEGYGLYLVPFLFIVSAYFLIRVKSAKIKINSIFFFLFVIIFLIIHALFKSANSYLSSYLGLIIRFTLAFLITTIIIFKEFINKYINIMVLMVAISLIFYFGGLIFPELIQKLPISYNDAGTGYRCAYIHFYQGITSWNLRNSGIFWEGGAFQVFINIALLFRIFYQKKSFRDNKIITSILIIGVLSTISIIGIFILCIMLIFLVQNRKPIVRYILYLIGTVIIVNTGIIEMLIEKFNIQGSSGLERLAGILADMNIFINNPVLGAGFGYIELNFKNIAYSYGALIPSSTNSFSGSLALYGIIFSSIVCMAMFKLFININVGIKYKAMIIGVVIMLLSTQGVIFQLLFICFMFYGLRSSRNMNRERELENFVST